MACSKKSLSTNREKGTSLLPVNVEAAKVAVPRKTDTIAAIATPPGIGGIGIIRISGPDALSILRRIFRPHRSNLKTYRSHRLYYGSAVNRDQEILDEILAVYMRAPATYTREDVVELHSHGSRLVLQSILAEVFSAGARPAEPGEFTKRAFLAGRIDLTRAEAVIDLLQAKTTGGVRLAVGQLQGNLEAALTPVQDVLVRLLAFVEVAIDFPDDDVEILDRESLRHQLQGSVIAPVEELLRLAGQGKVIREGVHVVIAGRPNVGKSSLLNGLLREERALVTDIPGTTRDTIEEMIAIHGVPVHLVDTAGIHAHEDLVEALGIERARRKLHEADLVLFMIDARAGITRQDHELYQLVRERDHLVVYNKIDLVDEEHLHGLEKMFPGAATVRLSALTGKGLEELQEAIYAKVLHCGGQELEEQLPCAPNVRHKAILSAMLETCRRIDQALLAQIPADLLAVELQTALDDLMDITGVTTPEDVLEKIFSEFCIGK
ncbi:MAG TPA: tRNA uridine-5-carboxymethylaminomethyl(34) synthesis GTPase MnmE [Desulfobulbus sp.]|nr:tRNA uridine-5-carboxymethylaminomethyl(34) synthesis GTPase MnmE [Desulfobulbus sp.]